MNSVTLAALASFIATPILAESHVSGDVAAGEEAFARQCVTCHVVVNEAGEMIAGRSGKVGPNLYGVAGRTLGTVEGFRYSAPLVAAGESGTVWTEEHFTGFVQDPSKWLQNMLNDPSARSKMTYRVRKEEDASNIFAYLASVGPEVAMGETAPAAGADVAATTKPAPAAKPASFTSEQADRGESRYVKDCVECHGKDLKGGMNGGPPLRGLAFEEKYANGAPASAMFTLMSSSMPPNAPGRYSDSTYADLMAYILSKNGFREGAELPDSVDALDQLVVQK